MLVLFSITTLFLLAYGGLIIFYFISWKQIPDENFPDVVRDPMRVTVIIPARDEEDNILKCLESLQKQTYPSAFFQVIVINDHSIDKTASLVSSFPLPNLLLLNLEDHLKEAINSYKKKAIEIGIQHASGELIICTDADCTATPGWINSLVQSHLSTNAVFVAAPVRIHAEKSLLSIFQTLDFLSLQGITAAAVHRNTHAMSNGANLAYTKRAFYEVGGFLGIDRIASGDDMLLMQKMTAAYPANIKYLKCKEAIVTTNAEKNMKAFIHQRVRWASKAGNYRDASISAALLLVYLTNLLMGIFLISALIQWSWILWVLALLLLKTLFEFFFVRSVAKFYGQARLMVWFPMMQPLHIFYMIVAGWLGMFGSYEWKKRRVR